ncbi:TraB/GumN family protein [Photobacterium phosphoreum]|uniref:TraB/GumN family protein n=2 Tax=Photobacterium phosphoreum TaxID=659 RepID=UPI0005D45979|nr:TraB/GumN family protein [Photobacterium phosphoreum]KJF85442.1 polysaccharide biosynthesis protein GumN [Photobacterium phosphoreum]MCD9484866.1 TraB/GumN family protein [Photobacterium phosphoreum]PQJ91799.1 TraB/GumN family protein [Photobacterium phosphoreum]PSV70063.1 TraB/GumN family protein [Photobacterium phosphoreum]
MFKSLLSKALLLLPFISQPALAEPIIWKIYDQQREFYVLGSIHAGKEAMFPLPDVFLEQWQQADALIVEANILQQSNVAPTLAPPFTHQALSESTLQQLQKISKTLNLSFDQLLQQPPWLTAVTLQLALADKLDLKSDYGIDYVLLQRAQQQKLPIHELESVSQQFNMLENLPDNGAPMLIETINEWDKTQSSLRCLVKVWQHGDSNKLEQLFNESQFDPTTDDALIFDRNQHWAETLAHTTPYQSGKFMVVVGAFHLIGDQGLPNLMKQQGFKVEKITSSTKANCN